MKKYTGTFTFAGGMNIASGSPIDDRTEFDTIEAAIDFIINPMILGIFSIYEGLVIKVTNNSPSAGDPVEIRSAGLEYIWRRGSLGIIPGGYTYPAGSVIGGIDYSGLTYNLAIFSTTSFLSHTTVIQTDSIDIARKFIPISISDSRVATVSIIEGSDEDITYPDKVTFTADTMVIHFKPAVSSGVFLNIKVS